MSAQQQESRARRWSRALVGLTAALGTLSACAKIVGIEDTTVTRTDGSGGEQSSSGGPGAAGDAGASNAGASNAGTSNAGQSNGGSAPNGGAATAGAETGGASGETAGSGGLVNQAGAADNAGNGGSAGVSECPCSAPKPTCENGKCVVRGPTMAKATSFYIDSTEVSKAEYDVFLAAKGTDTSGQISSCSWNTSYAPDGVVDDPRPIVNVDWCDAAAFCAWADKRLCGAVGGGPIASPDDLLDSTKSQMYLACGGADGERYPYGGATYMAGYCNVTGGYMADVGKFNQCQGHYTGIFDLVGNAAEWIDYCDTGGGTDRSMDNCEVGGGSYLNDQFRCQSYDSLPRNTHGDAVGFRCCSK